MHFYQYRFQCLLSLLQLTVVSIFNLSICYHATLRNEDILEMLPHLLFLVDANPVVLNMLVHVLVTPPI